MNENFRYAKLKPQHKKLFVLYQIALFLIIGIMSVTAISITSPEIVETGEKISLTIGGILGFTVMMLAFFNRIKSLLKIKFVAFLIVWLILLSMQSIMETLLWSIGLVLIPLMLDDLIIIPKWNNLWYNNYE